MSAKEIKLNHPIPVKNGDDIAYLDSIIIGRLKAKHLTLLPSSFFNLDENSNSTDNLKMLSDMIPLIAGMANISEEAAGEIDMQDLSVVVEELSNFLVISLDETGKN